MMDRSKHTILVTGATGNQGGAVAQHLLDAGWTVRAMTRNADKAEARLLAQAGAEIAQADLHDAAAVRDALDGVYGVFSVQQFWGVGVEDEVAQGTLLAEQARAAGVQHFVYSSVGAAERGTGIPHFESKWRVEQRIRELELPATILRPVFFMENFFQMEGDLRDGRLSMPLEEGVSLQMIAVDDIGRVAAHVFGDFTTYHGRAVELAGDEKTGPEMAETFSTVLARPVAFHQQPMEEMRAASDELAVMFEWFNAEGYEADLQALADEFGPFKSLEQWAALTGWVHPEAERDA